MENLSFRDLVDVGILQQIQDSFSAYTGLASIITDEHGIPITKGSGFTDFCQNMTRGTKKGLAACEKCDKNGALMSHNTGKPAVYNCHAGLTDFAAPVILNGKVIGSVVGGQVRSEEFNEEKIRSVAAELELDPDEYLKAAEKTYTMPIEQVEKAAQFLSDMAKAVSDMTYSNYIAIMESRKTERAARSQSSFITGLTEDLRLSMRGWLDEFCAAAARYQNDPVAAREINSLLSKGQEVYSVIGGAVDYMRLTGGRAEYAESVYDIRTLVLETAETLKKNAEDAGVRLNTEFDSSIPETLIGNSGRLGQIISKLLCNVISFSDSGARVRVSVSCGKSHYASMLCIAISSDGISASEEQTEQLREVIRSGNVDIFGENKVIKELEFPLILLLVRQMSGSMELESPESGKAVFTLKFPQLDGSKKQG